jgi:hypothetical protein
MVLGLSPETTKSALSTSPGIALFGPGIKHFRRQLITSESAKKVLNSCTLFEALFDQKEGVNFMQVADLARTIWTCKNVLEK